LGFLKKRFVPSDLENPYLSGSDWAKPPLIRPEPLSR
jgi:hypothetical protein